MRLTTNKPPSLGLISSSLEDWEEVWEEELFGEGWRRMFTFKLSFKVQDHIPFLLTIAQTLKTFYGTSS